MIKAWIEDIRIKTKDMDRSQAAEYIRNYYWYHILLGAIAMGLLFLLLYHVFWGRNQKPEFTCVIVNEEVDFPRDARIAEEFSAFSGIREKKIAVDSDYLISYGEVRLPEANESSYEKFFFNWSAGVIDAMVMPESFYRYCLGLGGEFCSLDGLASEEMQGLLQDMFYQGDGGEGRAVCIKGTALEDWLQADEDDPLLLVFPAEMGHRAAAQEFLEYVSGVE